MSPNGKHPSEPLAPRGCRRHQPRSVEVRNSERVSSYGDFNRSQNTGRTSELSESRHCHRARILSSVSRPFPASLSLSLSFSPQCLLPARSSLASSRPPPTPCRRKRDVIDHPSRYGRVRVSLPCSRRSHAGAATRRTRASRRPRICRVTQHALFKIKTRNRAPIYFDTTRS